MRTTPEDRIREMTERGWWGTDTAVSMFREAVAAVPDQLALVDPPDRGELDGLPPRRLTFAEAAAEVTSMGARLRGSGVGRDDVIVAQLPNIVDQILLYLAVMEIGAIVSPIPMQYGTHELQQIVQATEPRAYLTIAESRGTPFLEPQSGAFPDGTILGTTSHTVRADVLALSGTGPNESVLAEHEAFLAGWHPDANDITTLCWTSGTTGTPKGVPRHHNHWLSQSANTAEAGQIGQGAVMLNPFPFVNMASFGGFFYLWLLRRGTLVLHHPFTQRIFLDQLVDEKVNYTVGAPTLLSRLLKSDLLDGRDLSHLNLIASGSAPLAPSMVRGFAERYNIDIANTFGSNEGVSLVSSAETVPDPAKRAELFPRFGVDGIEWQTPMSRRLRTKLVDDTGEEITEPGMPGELLYWGPTLFDGYWKSPQANAAVFDDDGFFHTGDLFEIVPDDPRFYRIVGRIKDIIIRGGMKLSASELDSLIAGFDQAADGAVVGYPDPDLGERVCAVLVPSEGREPTLEDLTTYLRAAGVAIFKLPERLLLAGDLPRNPLGKLVRRDLQEWVRSRGSEEAR